MNGDIYTQIATELKRLGGIDEIGVVSAAGQSCNLTDKLQKVKKAKKAEKNF